MFLSNLGERHWLAIHVDDGVVFCYHIVRVHRLRAFHAIRGKGERLAAILLSLTLTPTVSSSSSSSGADSGLLSLRLAFVLDRSRSLVVLVQSVEVLDVRLSVLFEIAQHGELARGVCCVDGAADAANDA